MKFTSQIIDMNLSAVSIGEAVPCEDFDAVIHSVFDSAVNLRLEGEERLITILVSEDYELPQGIRISTKGYPFQNLTPGMRAASRVGILRFEPSSLAVNMRAATVWKRPISEIYLDTRSSSTKEAWSTVWDLLNKEQRIKNTDLVADDLYRAGAGSSLSQQISQPVMSLVKSTEGHDVEGALHAAERMIGLGPGLTPTGDDVLIGFLAGLWSTAGQNGQRLGFINSFGIELNQLASQTSVISRTYIFHAAEGQFSSALSNLAEAIGAGNDVERPAQTAMRLGHSSGMDAVTGLLIGLQVWK